MFLNDENDKFWPYDSCTDKYNQIFTYNSLHLHVKSMHHTCTEVQAILVRTHILIPLSLDLHPHPTNCTKCASLSALSKCTQCFHLHYVTHHYEDTMWGVIHQDSLCLFIWYTLRPEENSQHSAEDIIKCIKKMTNIMQKTFSNAFCWVKTLVFWCKFHWNLFPGICFIRSQHWFR